MKYFLKASDCPDCKNLHPETIIAWQDFEPEESDERPWSIVGTIEEIRQVYQSSMLIIEKEAEIKRLEDEQKKSEAEVTEESEGGKEDA